MSGLGKSPVRQTKILTKGHHHNTPTDLRHTVIRGVHEHTLDVIALGRIGPVGLDRLGYAPIVIRPILAIDPPLKRSLQLSEDVVVIRGKRRPKKTLDILGDHGAWTGLTYSPEQLRPEVTSVIIAPVGAPKAPWLTRHATRHDINT